MPQVRWALPPTWETRMELLAPDYFSHLERDPTDGSVLARSLSVRHTHSLTKKKKKVNHHVRPLISYLTTQNIQNWFSYIWTPAWYHHLSLSHPCGRFCNESYQKCLQSEMLASPFAFPVHTLNSSNQAIYFPKDLHISNLHITILLNVLNVLH